MNVLVMNSGSSTTPCSYRAIARIRSVPLTGHARLHLGQPISLVFHQLASARIWQSGCETSIDIQLNSRWYEMLGELANIPTGTLIDMLFVILADEVTLTANDVAELEQIQRELHRRGEDQHWSCRKVN